MLSASQVRAFALWLHGCEALGQRWGSEVAGFLGVIVGSSTLTQ